jgi:hypothetical protein
MFRRAGNGGRYVRLRSASSCRGMAINTRHDVIGVLNSFERIGRLTVPYSLSSRDLTTWNAKNLSGYGVDRIVDGKTVTYTYPLREYRGVEEYPSSSRIMHTSASCITRYVGEDGIYEGDKIVYERPANNTGT